MVGRVQEVRPDDGANHREMPQPEHELTRKIVVGDRKAELVFTGDGCDLVSEEGDLRFALDPGMAHALLHLRNAERQLALRGVAIRPPSSAETSEADLYDLRRQLPDDELLVLLDSTTLQNGLSCVHGLTPPGPLGLIDLSILTFAAICCDRIVLQSSGMVKALMSEELASVSITLAYPEPRRFIRNTLWSLCVGVGSQGGHRVGQEAMTKAWNDLLYDGKQEVILDLHAHDEYQDSPGYWDGIPASHYFGDLFAPALYPSDKSAKSRNGFLSIQTIRTLYNDAVAGALGIPYVSSSLRSPIHWLLIREKTEMRLLLDQLLSEVGPPTVSEPDAMQENPYMAEFSAPFLLGLVLEKMATHNDYWPVVLDYRERFAPLRKRIAREREQWNGRSGAYLDRFLSEFRGASEQYGPRVRGVAGVGADVGVALTGLPVAVAIKLGVAALARPARREWLRRRRPDIYLLMSLSDEAKSLRMAEEQVRRIWGRSWDRAGREQLERLARGHPTGLARLRDLRLYA
jgi:hypothetical protein